MRRYSYLIGANGHEQIGTLRYAESDADSVALCLEGPRYGFEVFRPIKGYSAFDMLKQFNEIVSACESSDTLIFYFSGHGRLEKGQLFLCVDNNDPSLLNGCLPVNHIVHSLRYCNAKNILLMLDCCHAGGIDFKGPANEKLEEITTIHESDNYIAFVASERLSKIREYPNLKGSFFSKYFCKALNENFFEVDTDKDQHVSIQDVMNWFNNENKRFNQLQYYQAGHAAALPYIIAPKRKGTDFLFTQDSYRWIPYQIPYINETTFTVLPIIPSNNQVLCISKYPVTNKQYKKFISETNKPTPLGKYLDKDSIDKNMKNIENWRVGFEPFLDNNFNHPNKPVVCVSYVDAQQYCEWINKGNDLNNYKTFIPPLDLWFFAALREINYKIGPKFWLSETSKTHHQTYFPEIIDIDETRTNKFGVSDMFGNVWEWCSPSKLNYASGPITYGKEPYLVGGGFQDNLNSLISVSLGANRFADNSRICHFDLGFRIAMLMPLDDLPQEWRIRLSLCLKETESLWYSVNNILI